MNFTAAEANTLDSQLSNDRANRNYWAAARMKPGVTLAQARADLDSVGRRLAEQFPRTNRNTSVAVEGVLDHMNGLIKPALIVLAIAIGLVMLIGCANVANLLLARATSRQREIAIRAALGASRPRLFRQLLTESTLLSLAGGAIGLAVGMWATKILVRLSPNAPRLNEAGLDWRVMAFTAALSLGTGLVFGLLPAWSATRSDLVQPMKRRDQQRSGPLGMLVAIEIAVAVVLLIGAGLMMRSFVGLLNVDLGFNADRTIASWVMLPPSRYPNATAQSQFIVNVTDRLRSSPLVDAVGSVNALPLSACNDGAYVTVPGREGGHDGDHRSVAGDYFRALAISVHSGRAFDSTDRADSNPVCILSKSFAQKLWPGEDPLGRTVTVNRQKRTIVGVVSDVRHYGLDLPARQTVYVPAAQSPDYFMQIAVRAKGDPRALGNLIAREVAAVDREQPVFNTALVQDLVDGAVAKQKFEFVILAIFAGLAITLAAVGIYGVTAYAVGRRTQEIGVRMSLGARPGAVVGMMLGQGMRWAIAGLACGLVGAWAVARFLESFLFGVKPTDALTFSIAAGLVIVIAALANFVPARRATRINPVTALRCE